MSHNQEIPSAKESAPLPRWVQVFGIVFVVLVLLFVVLHLTGNGMGGMHMHMLHTGVAQP